MSRYSGRITAGTIGTVQNDKGQVLLIQRTKEPYIGAWAMPGGKIEVGEHPDETMIREFYEETGLRVEVKRFCGVVSEVMDEPDISHFLLYVFSLRIVGGKLHERATEEGPLEWFSPENLAGNTVPSDEWMIQNMVLSSDGPRFVSFQSSESAFQLLSQYR
jgi:8-oxo-dGTP pyrophosphatase MutT (NUDIX family)